MVTDDQGTQILKTLKKMDERFDKVDEKFDRMDEKFDKVDEKFDKVNEQFQQIDKRFDKIDEQFDKIDQKFEQIDGRLDKVDGRLDKIDGRLDKVDGRLDGHDSTFEKIISMLVDHDNYIKRLPTREEFDEFKSNNLALHDRTAKSIEKLEMEFKVHTKAQDRLKDRVDVHEKVLISHKLLPAKAV